MMMGKSAFITGAARGPGREIARALARDGWRLYWIDILASRLENTAADLRAAGHEVISRGADVFNHRQCAMGRIAGRNIGRELASNSWARGSWRLDPAPRA